MKKLSIILISFIFLIPATAKASFDSFPYVLKLAKSAYLESKPVIKNLKDTKRGSYLPGVFDSKILNFKQASVNAKELIKKKQEEERKKKEQERLRLGSAEAFYDGRYIDIDLRTQTLTVFENRNPVYRFKISTGRWNYPTPVGTFSIRNKIPRAYSSKYNLYMPWWMAFKWDGYGIHELPEWPSGAKEGAGHLGTPVSHGCVRLGVGPAKTVYDWASIGDAVYVHK